jgi:minor extracellular protease Epr
MQSRQEGLRFASTLPPWKQTLRRAPVKLPQRAKRFIVIPKPTSGTAAPSPLKTMRLMRLGPHPVAEALPNDTSAASTMVRNAALVAPVRVVNKSPADGALLLEMKSRVTMDRLKAQAPSGTRVFEEQWYSLERPARPWSTQGATLKKQRLRDGHTKNLDGYRGA